MQVITAFQMRSAIQARRDQSIYHYERKDGKVTNRTEEKTQKPKLSKIAKKNIKNQGLG